LYVARHFPSVAFGKGSGYARLAEHIHLRIKDGLLCLSFPIQKCRRQAYNGAANFQEWINGVAKKVWSEIPATISVHCVAHCVNLRLQCTAQGLVASVEKH